MRGAFLEDLTWPEAGARIAGGAVVVVPVGAAAKEHGPHLPLRTDYLVARELGRRVAEALPVLVAPVVFDADPGSGPDWSRTGARGDPSLASPETGEAALREITRELVDGLAALYPDLR